MMRIAERELRAILTKSQCFLRPFMCNYSSDDFFGLKDESPDVNQVVTASKVENLSKIKEMIDDHRMQKISAGTEKSFVTTFGSIRYDSHNLPSARPTRHPPEAPTDKLAARRPISVPLEDIKIHPTVTEKFEGLNFVDSNYFGERELEKSGKPEKSVSKREIKTNKVEKISENEGPNAFEFVRKLRASKTNVTNTDHTDIKLAEKCDSKGFRILKSQVPDIDNEPSYVVAKMLRDNILYNDHDIVAIYKPYGVSCQAGSGCAHSIPNYLPNLAKSIGGDNVDLHTVHRLDKETTGVLILAKNQIMAKKLHSLFVQKKIIKVYWAIVAGIPEHPEGTIDIPMAEGSVDGRQRMVLKPERTEETRLVVPKSWVKTYKAVTRYKILASSGRSCLLELRPETGLKHQLRVHLAFGLGCPILGDHKYSHLTKLAPQRLPGDMLQKLGIRQSKVRHVAMHLHAKTVFIPEILSGRYVSISANLPKHFAKNLNRLQIRVP